jgi:hypothetical protein
MYIDDYNKRERVSSVINESATLFRCEDVARSAVSADDNQSLICLRSPLRCPVRQLHLLRSGNHLRGAP